MDFKFRIKFILVFTSFILTLVTTQYAFASDYQYKILDPKYNPSAEKLLEGKLPPVEVVDFEEKQKNFDFIRFFAIIATIVFPVLVFSFAAKTLKKVMEEVPGRENDAEVINQKPTKQEIKVQTENNIVKEESQNTVEPQKTIKQPTVSNSNIEKALQKDQKTHEYSTSPIANKNPMLLNTLYLTKNKGFCLVEYNNKYSLIGYINNEIFLLNQFDSVSSVEIRSRLSETIDNKDRYIVRLGSYKALIEVSDNDMNLLVNL